VFRKITSELKKGGLKVDRQDGAPMPQDLFPRITATRGIYGCFAPVRHIRPHTGPNMRANIYILPGKRAAASGQNYSFFTLKSRTNPRSLTGPKLSDPRETVEKNYPKGLSTRGKHL
jgi:hypothetical protein